MAENRIVLDTKMMEENRPIGTVALTVSVHRSWGVRLRIWLACQLMRVVAWLTWQDFEVEPVTGEGE
jgi:hypothetical protein